MEQEHFWKITASLANTSYQTPIHAPRQTVLHNDDSESWRSRIQIKCYEQHLRQISLVSVSGTFLIVLLNNSRASYKL